MRFDVVTLFPEMCEAALGHGVVGRALRETKLTVRYRNLREFGIGKHRRVDDTPCGGGAGMVMRVDCLVDCMDAMDADAPLTDDGDKQLAHRVLLTPQGAPLSQRRVQQLVERPAVMLVCGRYEGFDERVRSHISEELSIGDFVLSGGELAALVVIDACARLLPGVLGNEASLSEESHSCATGGALEYPHYTRPTDFHGEQVPEVLLSGDHGKIAAWRRERSRERTLARRPDVHERGQGGT